MNCSNKKSISKTIAIAPTERYGNSMESVADHIARVLQTHFAPAALQVADDSAKHAGHAGARPEGNTHFSVTIVSAAFQGQSRVARHRAVYAVLEPFFQNGLHALAINAKAPGE